MYQILICDDNQDIVSAIRIYLNAEGYQTICTYNGEECLEVLRNREIHLVLLDIMMPCKDGFETISELRKWSNVPVIMLSAKSEDIDKISSLNIGADDYITKPFNPVELLARVKSQLRRYMKLGGGSQAAKETKSGGLSLDDASHSVMVDSELIPLTPLEYEILSLLMKNPGRVFSPKEICKLVWNGKAAGTENAVAVHIRHIREKIEIDPAEPRYLKVVWGKGYKIQNGTQ